MLAIEDQGLDQEIAKAFTYVGNIVTFLPRGLGFVIDKIDQLLPPVEEKRQYHADVPALIDVARRIYYAFKDYHFRIIKSSIEWSNDIKNATEKFVKLIFIPLSICHFGDVLRTIIARDVMGNIAKVIFLVAFQFFHLIPYLLIGSVFKGVNFLYMSAPVALLAGLAVTILSLQVYLIYRLVKEIEVSNQILEQKLGQANNLVAIAGKTLKGIAAGAAVVGLAALTVKVFSPFGAVAKDVGRSCWTWCSS